jgi:hypothetical protein
VEAALLGIPPSQWWNSECFEAMVATSAVLFAGYDVLKKLMGIADTVFEVTPKAGSLEESQANETAVTDHDIAANKKTSGQGSGVSFDSAMLVPPTVIVMVNLAALCLLFIHSLLGHNLSSSSSSSISWAESVLALVGRVEVWCCAWVLFVLRPFTLGLVLRIFGRRPAAGFLHPRVILRASSLSFLLLAILLVIRP